MKIQLRRFEIRKKSNLPTPIILDLTASDLSCIFNVGQFQICKASIILGKSKKDNIIPLLFDHLSALSSDLYSLVHSYLGNSAFAMEFVTETGETCEHILKIQKGAISSTLVVGDKTYHTDNLPKELEPVYKAIRDRGANTFLVHEESAIDMMHELITRKKDNLVMAIIHDMGFHYQISRGSGGLFVDDGYVNLPIKVVLRTEPTFLEVFKSAVAIVKAAIDDTIILYNDFGNCLPYEMFESLYIRFMKLKKGMLIATTEQRELLRHSDLYTSDMIQIYDPEFHIPLYTLASFAIEDQHDLYKVFTAGKVGGIESFYEFNFRELFGESDLLCSDAI